MGNTLLNHRRVLNFLVLLRALCFLVTHLSVDYA